MLVLLNSGLGLIFYVIGSHISEAIEVQINGFHCSWGCITYKYRCATQEPTGYILNPSPKTIYSAVEHTEVLVRGHSEDFQAQADNSPLSISPIPRGHV